MGSRPLPDPAQLDRLLAEESGEALTRLVLESPAGHLHRALDNPRLEDPQLLLLLRRPDLPSDLLEKLATTQPWSGRYLVKAAVVNHPHTPRTPALNLVKHLFWRDLARLLLNYQVSPAIRRAAEVTLKDRLDEISMGERVSLARVAPREIVRALRAERDPRVLRALLDNPRMTEEDLTLMIVDRHQSREGLEAIGRAERWMARGPLRRLVVCARATPLDLALRLLPGLVEAELRKVAECVSAAAGVRSTARRLLRERGPRQRPADLR